MDAPFYTYALLDPRKPGSFVYGEYRFDFEPFYIGKGKGKRMYVHNETWALKKKTRKNNKIKSIIDDGYNHITVKISDYLLEKDALENEIRLISEIGRLDNNTGILTNHTDGGDGVSGHKHSYETRQKLTKISTGKKQSKETIRRRMIKSKGRILPKEQIEQMVKTRAMNGKKYTDIQKKRMSDAHRGKKLAESTKKLMSISRTGDHNHMFGKKHTEEACKKMSEKKAGKEVSIKNKESKKRAWSERERYLITDPNKNIIKCGNLKQFCREHYLNLNTMQHAFWKGVKTKCGWTIVRIGIKSPSRLISQSPQLTETSSLTCTQ